MKYVLWKYQHEIKTPECEFKIVEDERVPDYDTFDSIEEALETATKIMQELKKTLDGSGCCRQVTLETEGDENIWDDLYGVVMVRWYDDMYFHNCSLEIRAA